MSIAGLDSLAWIKTELERTLETARLRLDAYAEEPGKRELLDAFIEGTHQTASTLTMIAVRGGEMLAGHMEELARAIRDGRAPADARNLEALMRASLELSDYLEHVAAGMRDTPAALLPLINELRAALGKAELVRERLGRPVPTPEPRPDAEAPAGLAARLRRQYQTALLAYYQGDEGALARLRDVVRQLEAAVTSPAAFEFLWVTGALLEALAEDGLDPTLSVKRMLGQVERELKRLAMGSEAAVAETPPEELIESMLGELEHARSHGERVLAIRGNFGLEDAAAAPGGVGSALLASAGGAILEDLGRVRDRIDIFVRTRSDNVSDLEPIVGILKKVGDALEMLGLEAARTHIEHERKTVQGLVERGEVEQAALLGLATGLIGVESDVEAFLAGSGEDPQTLAERGARVAGMREALADISRIKETVTEYLHDPAGSASLVELPQLAELLARTLAFLSIDEVVAPMRRIARYLQRLATVSEPPERKELDRLADAVVSIEYYLETVQRGRTAPDSMLENADRALRALGIGEEEGAGEGPRTFEVPKPPPAAEISPPTPIELPPVRAAGADPEIVAVFLEEAAEVGETLAEAYPVWREDPDDREALVVIRRAFHTLKGSGRMVGAQRLGEFAWAYENLLNRVIDYTLAPSAPIVVAVGDAIVAVGELLEQFDTGVEPSADVRGLLAHARELVYGEGPTVDAEPEPVEIAAEEADAIKAEDASIEFPEPETPPQEAVEPETTEAAETTGTQELIPRLEPTLYGIYRRETEEHFATLDAWLEEAVGSEATLVTADLHRAVHTLSGGARMAGVAEMDALFSPLDYLLRNVDEGNAVDGSFVPVLAEAAAMGAQLLSAYADASLPLPDWEPVAARTRALQRASEETEPTDTETPESAEAVRPVKEKRGGERPSAVVDLHAQTSYDAELAQVFTLEATELLDGSDAAVQTWKQDHTLTAPLTDLLRRLHTLKGGARMAGVAPLADLTHELEALLIRVGAERVAVSEELLHLVERTLDRLHRMLAHVSGDGRVPFDAAIIAELREFGSGEPLRRTEEAEAEAPQEERIPAEEEEEAEEVEVAEGVEQSGEGEAELALEEDGEPEEEAAERTGAAERAPSHHRAEMARVRADLLESSINNAGEVSIYRGRIEQQLVNMNLHLVELDRTVERVRNQLRELEIETEAQILSEHRPEAVAPDFDPLEFDRYTRIHELSRSLAEAVSDLASLRSLFATELRQASVLLERQGRVNAEMQDALMRTRMVPFALSAPRLRRVVRQIAEESGKRVEFELSGLEGEVDRQLLGHILPALEHLLRNAVVHGIEEPAVRESRGKPETGHVKLNFGRDGGDMLIEVADDGGGLDLEAIRARAVAEGIIAPDAESSDAEITELVFRPGFSTAAAVTQSAGRGVGMDVVAAEVRQIGGSTEIESTPLEGMCCRMRLPATLAITQVLLVRIGSTPYPVALASISGVARPTREELSRLLEAEEPAYEYGGERYELLSLARLLGEEPAPPDEQAARQPLLLVNAGGRRIALIAEDMEGSREIVVKPVGPQVAGVPGLAGATVFGDGTIGLLLDLSSLVRALPQLTQIPEAPSEIEWGQEAEAGPLIMVVDDSITVRRVTQRLLERNGARVLTAKDGVEALELLQDHLPDVMLLDIEMPRMDGYELAGHMKNDERLREVPIIVITSRTGEKHRARASQIGIESYLGKPYQDTDLLGAIRAQVPGFADAPAHDWEG